jgi:hypothetical protein
MSQTVKANRTSNNRKTASAALAFVFLARFLMQLRSRFWTIVSQLSQCDPEQLAQEEDEAREAQEARIRRRDEEDRIRRVDVHLNRDAVARPTRERAKILNQADAARVAWENELRRRQYDRGLDGPSIER